MKKKLVSLVLVAVIVFSMCVPAFATTKFNQSVFDDKKDSLFIDTDDMTGTTSVYPVAWLLGQTSLFLDDSSFIMLDPIIYLTDSNDYFNVHFKYYGTTPFYFNGITIKVGDNRYSFLLNNLLENRLFADSSLFAQF